MMIAALMIFSLIACYYDWRWRIIPNLLCAAILLTGFVIIAFRGDFPHWSALLITFVIAIALWRFRIWGAGDSKLLLAFFPMIDSQFYIATIAFIGLTGCATALIFLLYRRLSPCCKFNSVPYGIPIALSCFVTSVASF
ncbi:hypothetical protein HGP28_09295 [Vibrio sp. SM6]|uniref:Prepilin type IV endopeptidase peptidase domain-containing protein n=1 Tax=Vibrio agarilyticus TaxID=2726741 RepID=A0A7X8TQP3_9VIBR|nr:prepilin peptidase [Vibrio agarilyticus]NLS13083.1 hypothetical protein [Vibrio agarilyticus]